MRAVVRLTLLDDSEENKLMICLLTAQNQKQQLLKKIPAVSIQLLCCIFRVIIGYLTVLFENEFFPLIITDKLYITYSK